MGRLEPRPDGHQPGLRIFSTTKVMSVDMLDQAVSTLGMIRVLVAEVLREVPGADFIEIRAVRYDQDKEGNDERNAPAVPPG